MCVHTQRNELTIFCLCDTVRRHISDSPLIFISDFGTILPLPFPSMKGEIFHNGIRPKHNILYCSQNRQTYRTNVPHKHTQYVACSQVSEFRVKVIDLDLLKTHLLGKGKSKIQCTANGTSFAQQRIIPILKAAGRPAIIDVCPCSIQTYAS